MIAEGQDVDKQLDRCRAAQPDQRDRVARLRCVAQQRVGLVAGRDQHRHPPPCPSRNPRRNRCACGATRLSVDPRGGEVRRHHVHESGLQKARTALAERKSQRQGLESAVQEARQRIKVERSGYLIPINVQSIIGWV